MAWFYAHSPCGKHPYPSCTSINRNCDFWPFASTAYPTFGITHNVPPDLFPNPGWAENYKIPLHPHLRYARTTTRRGAFNPFSCLRRVLDSEKSQGGNNRARSG